MMRRLLPFLMLGIILVQSCKKSETQVVDGDLDPATEKKIDDLLAQMTVEEKVGQMTQLTLSALAKDITNPADPTIDSKKLAIAIQKYKLGSILNVVATTFTRDKWYEVMGMIQTEASKTRLKIPVLYGIDAIHGVTYTKGSTLFPQELAMAASWNPALAEQAGSITAYEVRASAIPWNFSPVLDLGRQPLWSRFFETYGEDPYLATQLSSSMIKGYEGNDISNPEKVASCLKHYVGYSFAFNGKDRTPILMPERLLREYYLVPFEQAIKQGAMTVMINSSEINGTPVHADHHILTDILKDELKFKGFAVSDWEDIVMLYTVHKVAATPKEAVKIAVNAGVDMSMVPFNYEFADYLVQLVNEKEVPMTRIDDAVRRILRVKFKLGLFEHMFYPKENYPKFGSTEFAQANYNAATECVTLLKNTANVLPLAKDKKILVVGPGANTMNTLNGSWTHSWQGTDTTYSNPGKKTILQALQDKVGAANVTFIEGASFKQDMNTAKAATAAKSADYVVVCLSELPSVEKPGDFESLDLPLAQKELVRALAKSGKPLIFVLSFNRPLVFNDIEPLSAGVVIAGYLGDEGGRAVADVLYGDVNPSGRMPFTYPRFTASLYTYDHKFSEEKDINNTFEAVNPQYAFGEGLSYTTFAYSDLKISGTQLKANNTLKIEVTVTNTGTRAGKEVVQVYSKDLFASITPSVKRLKRFQKIDLQAGEKKVVSFSITATDLGFVGNDLKWVTEDGGFEILVKDLKAPFEYSNK